MASGETYLDAIAGLSGKTAFEVWESGNDWKTIIKNAESVLGKRSKWNVLADEAGNPFMIVGKNGFLRVGDSAAGAAEEYIAGNQLVTDVIKEESGALTAYTGNIVNEAGEVTKKGLALGASTGAKAVMGALSAFGAVATGVNWYKENPEFWTDVSQKLLPFAYKDPTNKSWGDIFYDALSPTAVDSEGITYIPATLAEQLAQILVDNGVFDVNNTYKVKEGELLDVDSDFYGVSLSASILNREVLSFDTINVKELYAYSESLVTGLFYLNDGFHYLISVSDNDYMWGTDRRAEPIEPSLKYRGTRDSYNNKSFYYTSTGYGNQPITATNPILSRNDVPTTPNWQKVVAYILLYGTVTSPSKIDNVTVNPDYTHPDTRPLKEVYPDWYNNSVTTVNPNWKPNEPESEENPKYVTWIPLQFPDKDVPDGDTQPDTTPEDAQSGKPKPNNPVNPDTETAINDGVLPNPNPNPETQPSSGTSPDTPTPTPSEPQENIPYITGSASALWKIYNPSQAVLQQFGAWLWSSDPVKMIKELFSNNPADGIIGLHMIYVTPIVGGTSNIVVGYVDSGVASNYVSEQYVNLDCGSVTIPLRYQSALDYGYTKVYIYLPFIGIVPLDSFDIIGKTVHVKYTVDVLTGIVLAQVMVSLGSYEATLYTFNGSCSVEYPLTSGSRSSQMLSLITGAVGGAVVGGTAGAVLGGARGALTGADVRMSGNLSGNAGAMGIRKPYIIVKRPVEVPALGYNSFYGYPANITGVLNSFSGYVRVKEVHVDDISGASADEKREIEGLLKAGVIIS